jgi:hypothetical protein
VVGITAARPCCRLRGLGARGGLKEKNGALMLHTEAGKGWYLSLDGHSAGTAPCAVSTEWSGKCQLRH